MSLCDPQIEKIPGSAISIEIPLCWNATQEYKAQFQEYKAQFIRLGLKKNHYTCKKSSSWKSWWFCVLRHNPHSPKILKNAINFDKSHYSNNFVSNSRYEFIIQNLNSKPTPCRRRFDWTAIDSDHCIKILIVQTFQKIVTKNDWSRLTRWCFSVITGLNSLMRVTISNFALKKKDSNQILFSRFFASNFGLSQKSNAFFIDFCRYSIWKLSLTINLNFSINVAIKSLKLLEWKSFRK